MSRDDRVARNVVYCGVVIVVVIVQLLAMTSCTSEIAGNPVAAIGSGASRKPAPDDYAAPENGSGWASQPFDQPSPVPGYNWEGWKTASGGRCAWVPEGLFASLRPSAPPAPGGHFCIVGLAGGDLMQITWGGAYNAFLWDPLAFSTPVTVAGLEGRLYDLARNQQAYPGSCQVGVNTRSLSELDVLIWNPHKSQPHDPEPRCRVAFKAAEMIARRMVPAAGGAVWARTPQRPSNSSVDGKDACKVVGDLVTVYVGVDHAEHRSGRDDRETTCRYQQRSREIDVRLTAGPHGGLADLEPSQGKTTPRTLGVLPARQEISGRTCAVAVEFVPGRTLRTQYADDIGDGRACKAAEVLAAQAVHMMLERT